MKHKKLFAILTLVCFMFTLMPVAAMASNPTTVTDEQGLIDAIAEGGEVVLGGDIALTNTLVVTGQGITLDLNGKTVSGTDTKDLYSLIHVQNNGDLIIVDNSTEGTGKITYAAGDTDKTGTAVYVEGNLVLESGTIEITGDWVIGFAVDAHPNAWGTTYTQPTTFTMTGGNINASDSGVRVANYGAANSAESATFNMEGGEINSVYDGIFIQHVVDCDLNVNIFSNSTITSETTHALRIYGDVVNDVNVKISGGVFTGKLTNLDITGNGETVVSGGTFSDLSVVDYLATDADVDIVLADDVELTEILTIPADTTVTLDLNGNVLSGTCNVSQGHLIMVENTATLNVCDNSSAGTGKITYALGSSDTGWTIDLEGVLNLYSGTIELTGSPWNIGYAVDVRPNSWGNEYQEGTVFHMYDGKVISSDGAIRVASSSADSHEKVSATFIMDKGLVDAVYDGLFVQQSNGIYDVLNVTVNDGEIEAGRPIRIYGPAPTDYVVEGGKPITVSLAGGNFEYTEGANTPDWLIEKVIAYRGGVTSEQVVANTTLNITGGTFDGNPIEYVAEGYVAVADGANFVVKPEVKATGITISSDSLTLVEGATSEALTVALTPDTTTDTLGEVTWTSSNEAVATVANGVVTAVAAGEATITAKAGEKTATCVVTVKAKAPEVIAVTNIKLSQTAATLTVGETVTLTATVEPDNATDKTVTWESSDEKVVTVVDGVVTAVAAGEATITAKAGEKTATCVVTVKAKAPEVIAVTNIKLSQTAATLTVGETVTLTATVEPDNATDKTVTWESSDEKVVTVVDGVVTAVAEGQAGIKATAGEWTVACIVTVEAAPVAVTGVTLDKTTAAVKVGNTVQLTATVAPEGATNKNVTWASDNTSVATVDATGKVTAVAKGTANITVTTECGAFKDTCAVTVSSAGGGYVSGGSSSSSSSNKTESSTTTTVTPSGSTVKVETETKTESDGTKVETETTTTTTTTGETTKVETTTETKTDGTVVETTTTTDSKGDTTTVEKTTETNDEGTKVETTVTTDAQGETATTVTATLDNGSAVTNKDEAVKVEVTKVDETVVTKVEEAVAADETVEVVGTADNAVSVSATNSSTGAAQSNFVQPMSVNVPVDKAVLDNVTDTSKLTMAKVVTNEDGTTELVYMGGSYDEETGTFNAKVDEDGDYILVEKADLVKIELTIDDTTVKHNDNHHEMDVAPKINAEEGRTELPLRYLGEALGFGIEWNNNVVTITKGDTVFSMEIGKEIPGFGTPYIDSDRTMVSARYISEMLGANVIWDPVDRQVIVVK